MMNADFLFGRFYELVALSRMKIGSVRRSRRCLDHLRERTKQRFVLRVKREACYE